MARSVAKAPAGNDKMKKISGNIAKGAMSFLKAEYKVLSGFIVIVAILLAVTANAETSSWTIMFAFIAGALLSALAGFIGMKIATKANTRTTQAATKSLKKALKVSFQG